MAKFPCNLEFVREDDHVEYFIFPQLPEKLTRNCEQHNEEVVENLRAYLDEIQKQCLNIVAAEVEQRSYIWHKDEFGLRVRTSCAHEALLNDEEISHKDKAAALAAGSPSLPPHLHGVTHYGDNIQDEWFIVYLLYALTKQLPECIVRVIDGDGEFLLIEAADMLPKWADPESCQQRVYISNGHLQLVQNSPASNAKRLSVATALEKIRLNPMLYRVSVDIESCITERLKECSNSNNLHHQIANLPLGVAALLKERPSLIAPAVRMFCERDPIDLKACRRMRYFPPEQRVRTTVRFTRCLYAMIMHSNYKPDRKIGWNLTGDVASEQYKEDLLGIKIASGFEILALQAKDDAAERLKDAAWKVYVRNLTGKGYFRDNLEGSQQYQKLLDKARSYYESNQQRFRSLPIVGQEVLDLLRNLDINAEQLRDAENNLKPSDSDDWLNISAAQLDEMLLQRYGPKHLYKANGDINAQEFTKNIADFLDKESIFDGIDNDSDDDDDSDDAAYSVVHEVNTKNESKPTLRKNKSMRKACKQNVMPEKARKSTATASATKEDDSTHVRNFLDFVIPEDCWESNSEMSDYEDEKDLERNIEALMKSDMDMDVDIKTYMAQMDKELANTTIGQTFAAEGAATSSTKKTKNKNSSAEADDFDDIESFKPININVNTLKNMLDSYKSQIGGAGPVSNLLSAMGVGMSAAAEEQPSDLSESTV